MLVLLWAALSCAMIRVPLRRQSQGNVPRDPRLPLRTRFDGVIPTGAWPGCLAEGNCIQVPEAGGGLLRWLTFAQRSVPRVPMTNDYNGRAKERCFVRLRCAKRYGGE